eukprot:TRINITY_DN1799_c0_g1_i1.p1 TRINITY_DN1799_c0_g1~~TRINITY_DN1799_c0_g1_i1.p1  ORF type:complete len:173 (-),score=38.95 TRINITY_DN1799_c0_g1_i1:26-544(-)
MNSKVLCLVAMMTISMIVIARGEVVSATQHCINIPINTPTGQVMCSSDCLCDYITCPCANGNLINVTLSAICLPHNGTAAASYCSAATTSQNLTCPSGTLLVPQSTHTTNNAACIQTTLGGNATAVSGGLVAAVVVTMVLLLSVVGILVWKRNVIISKLRTAGKTNVLLEAQ